MDNSIIQSILFKKSVYTMSDVLKWLRTHNTRTIKIDITSNYYRCRQIDPSELKDLGYTHYYTNKINDGDIEFIIAYKLIL